MKAHCHQDLKFVTQQPVNDSLLIIIHEQQRYGITFAKIFYFFIFHHFMQYFFCSLKIHVPVLKRVQKVFMVYHVHTNDHSDGSLVNFVIYVKVMHYHLISKLRLHVKRCSKTHIIKS